MDIRFWGTRGSIPAPLGNAEILKKLETVLKLGIRANLTSEEQIPDFIENLPWHLRMTAGGNTSCVEINTGQTRLILDAGSGIRGLGLELMKTSRGNPLEIHLLLSHTHWDHICGIPFFVPAFNPANQITVYGPHPDLEERLRYQQEFRFFPVPLMNTFRFVQLKMEDHFHINDVEIRTMPLKHPGASFGYRITHDNKTVVYATDSEYKELSAEALKPFTDSFFKDADVLIFDAQYTMVENVEKEDWGHSNVFTGIDMALAANVKNFVFTHHEPVYGDQQLWDIWQKSREYLRISGAEKDLWVDIAFDGKKMTI